ncbi:MAG: VPLPA-CTERM sorting domain-containing protein [Litoreibacter sp.]
MKSIILSVGLTAVSAMGVNAATIAAFTSVASEGALSAETLGTGVASAEISRGSGLTARLGSSLTFNSNNWSIGGSQADASAAGDFLSWDFVSSVGYDLTSLAFGYDRSATGPVSIALDIILRDDFTNEITSQEQIFADVSVASNSTETAFIDLSAFDAITNAEFRLFGWGATGSSGTFDIENRASLGTNGIVISGEVSAVPLPASLPLLAGAFGLLAWGRRRA